MEICKKEDAIYFHTTNPKNIPSIEKYGLLVEKCHIGDIRKLYSWRTSPEEAEKKICKPMIFVVDLSHAKEEWKTGGDWMDVIGIKRTKKGDCADLFRYGGINNPFEYVSYHDISPHCLCLIDPDTL